MRNSGAKGTLWNSPHLALRLSWRLKPWAASRRCIAKTLSFAVGDRVALVVCAGDARIANPKFKAQFGCKPRMLPAEEAEERIGHAVGGVCPFAVNEGCDVYLDESLRRFDVVYPACGSSNSAIALTLDELAAYTPGSIWVDVCKLPE